eukprot:TRINITY_DN3731_c0_g1_i3.p1 TRINITY_DN3731_c0_g1~~TRINITY_DN3731_c0_g1_i3.p1  ORF type:complete len:101 (-),score=10.13 TRINITY_DN3731_c0_g1_i3:150-452(-)
MWASNKPRFTIIPAKQALPNDVSSNCKGDSSPHLQWPAGVSQVCTCTQNLTLNEESFVVKQHQLVSILVHQQSPRCFVPANPNYDAAVQTVVSDLLCLTE